MPCRPVFTEDLGLDLVKMPLVNLYRCPKPQESVSKSGRHLRRSFFQDYLDRVHSYCETEVYQKDLRKRQVWVGPLFGEGKQWHGMARFRLRGLLKVNIEGLPRAAGQNIKRLLNAEQLSGKHTPAGRLQSSCDAPTFLLSCIDNVCGRYCFFFQPHFFNRLKCCTTNTWISLCSRRRGQSPILRSRHHAPPFHL
jgi:hypothetical protein